MLVLFVVFLFLLGWRATLIPLCAGPVSLIGTFMLFPLFGFGINTPALFGLVLAIGLNDCRIEPAVTGGVSFSKFRYDSAMAFSHWDAHVVSDENQ